MLHKNTDIGLNTLQWGFAKSVPASAPGWARVKPEQCLGKCPFYEFREFKDCQRTLLTNKFVVKQHANISINLTYIEFARTI